MDAFTIKNQFGHYAVTKAALSDFYGALPGGRIKRQRIVPLYGIHWIDVEGSTALDILLDGVRDVDLYQFSIALPHAQTPTERATWLCTPLELSTASERAMDNFTTMQAERLMEIRARLNRGDIRVGAYQLGMFLHSLQDLLTHRGITNPQHQLLDDHGQSPDIKPGVAVEAHRATLDLLLALPQVIGVEADRRLREALGSGKHLSRLNPREKRRIFGRGMDVFWSAPAYVYGPRNPSALDCIDQIRWPAEEMAAQMTGPNALKPCRASVGVERRSCKGSRISALEALFYLPGQALHLLIGRGF